MDIQKILHYKEQALPYLLDLIFPPQCGGCKRSGSVLCSSCATQFKLIDPPFCQHCHSLLAPTGNCQRCHFHKLRLSGLRVAYMYQDPLRTCIHNFKYNGNIRLASPLGLLLAKAYRASNIQADMIIPVPLYTDRLRQRGYNQAHLLAKVCAQATGVSLNTSVLERIRDTREQMRLQAYERYSNVAEAFCCSSSIATKSLVERRIVVIDDVCTTGATLEACAAPLFAAGASEVWGLVLARPMSHLNPQ